MITVAIVIILTSIALPNLKGFLIENRVDNEVSELHRLLLAARNTAINESRNVTVCPLNADRDNCTNLNNWSGIIGVIYFVNGAQESFIVRQKDAIKEDDRLIFQFNSLTYNSRGQLVINIANPPPVAIFSYCPKNHDNYARGIEVSISGRSYITVDQNNNGIDQVRAGGNIVCP
jgi:type II secretory pathway pseudopilin PulG